MNKELEEAIKRLAEINEKVEEYDGNILKQDIETVLNYIENSIPKQVVEEKMIIDMNKLNHSTNGILAEMYKSRITLEKELLEGK